MFLSFLYSCRDTKQTDELTIALVAKSDSLKMLKSKLDSLAKQNVNLKRDLNYWFSDEDIDALKEKGLIDPLKDITNRLYDNPELIPYPGVLGGTMHFGNISLLRDRWVIVDFDDGHIMGAMILKYEVRKDTSLKWTVIDKYLE